jgi:hypothetical protein
MKKPEKIAAISRIVQMSITFFKPSPECIQPQIKAYKPQINPRIPVKTPDLNMRINTIIQQTRQPSPIIDEIDVANIYPPDFL